MRLEFEKLTADIIEVYKTLGPGFLGSVYENALSLEFGTRAIPYKRQWEISIFYNRNKKSNFYRIIFLIFLLSLDVI